MPRSISRWNSFGAFTRFFPKKYQPSFRLHKSASTNFRTATSVRNPLAGLQSFLYVLASSFARHPDRSYRDVVTYIRQPCLLLPSTIRVVTFSHVGYTSRPSRAIDGRGLSPHQTYSLAGRIRSRRVAPKKSCLLKSLTPAQSLRLWVIPFITGSLKKVRFVSIY